jgi:DGQHR domain-containing protein
MIQVNVFRFEQNGQVMFASIIRASELLRIVDVDVRDELLNSTGYQRQRDETRCRKIAEYINRPTSVIPGSILLNLRGSSSFQPDKYDQDTGKIFIPDKKGAAWVVDGQHRIGGFEYTERDFLLPVVFFENLPRRQEMINFSVINDTQKGINTSLTLSLLGELRESEACWKIRAHDIVYSLNNDPESPWYERVNMTGARGMHRPVNLASFANSLKPLLCSQSFFENLELSDQILLLRRFWCVLREMYLDAWCEPSSHILLKTLGVYTMGQVALYVFQLCAANQGDFSHEQIAEFLEPIRYFDWHQNTSPFHAMGGMKGCKEATSTLVSKLPKLSVRIDR